MAIDGARAQGFTPEALPWLAEGAAAFSDAAAALDRVGAAIARARPDALVLVGDRFEALSASLAATLACVPIVHLHGGEETEGAFDNVIRHAITKMAHVHLVSHPAHARRVIALGEDPATVHVVGAPGLDNLHRADLPSKSDLEAHLGVSLDAPVVVVTLHPATWGQDPAREVAAVVSAMDQVRATYVITLPNADPGNEVVRAALQHASTQLGRVAVEALGEARFWGLLRFTDAMLGNSSSALIEAPVYGVPAVNVGARQKGRVRGVNVIDAPPEAAAVADCLRRALDPVFRAEAVAAGSVFGDGHSAERIGAILRRWRPASPPVKRFAIPMNVPQGAGHEPNAPYARGDGG
jgi:UDP-hydrolysing UDP-N-acetyl-D-glucosamine 2-epimerase